MSCSFVVRAQVGGRGGGGGGRDLGGGKKDQGEIQTYITVRIMCA